MKPKKDIKWLLVRIFMYFILVFTVAISVFPVLWVLFSSYKTNSEILSGAFTLPSSLRTALDAYSYIFEKYNFVSYFFHSLLVSLGSTFVSLLIYSMAGYALSKFRFPGRNLLFTLFTITLLVPATAKAQPIFSLIVRMGLINTLSGLSMVYVSSGMAMSLFILRAAFLVGASGRRGLLPHLLEDQSAACQERHGHGGHPDVPEQLERIFLRLHAHPHGERPHHAGRAAIFQPVLLL